MDQTTTAAQAADQTATGTEASPAFPIGHLVDVAALPLPRHVPIDEDGNAVESGSDDHAYTRDRWFGLDWPVMDAATRASQDEADKVAAEIGQGFRLPTRAELLSIVDLSRSSPAVDPALFPNIEADWYRTSDPAAWSPADKRWLVHFSDGDSRTILRDLRARVRLVRSVSPSPRQ